MLAGFAEVRPASTAWDRRYDELARRDAFYERYGWTSQQYDETPQIEIEHLPHIWAEKRAVRDRAKLRADTAAAAKAAAATGRGPMRG